MPASAHHDNHRGFRNPWTRHDPSFGDLLKFHGESRKLRDHTKPGTFPWAVAQPAVPRAEAGTLSVTWIGHSSFLIQLGHRNILTDPVWSNRASPVPFLGPQRFMPPGLPLDALPPIDHVIISHDHYDHLDRATVRRLTRRHPHAKWATPLGVGRLITQWGARDVAEFDWWDQELHPDVSITCVPAQHFSGRSLTRNQTLWCGWVIGNDHHTGYFVGDTGMFPGFEDIADRSGPFDLIFMPIGAYDPRWFMSPVHLDPEEAVAAFQRLTRHNETRPCTMVGMHWGTFKLTTEVMTEPPLRTRTIWRDRGLPEQHLWILNHGETRWIDVTREADSSR